MKKEDYVKYPSIPYLEASMEVLKEPVYVFEKLDGGNCQVRKSKGRIITGSRSNILQGEIVNRVGWFRDFVSWANTQYELYNLEDNFALNGEWLAFHNISYAPENMDKFYLIDVFNIGEGRFLPYKEGLELLSEMGIPFNHPGQKPTNPYAINCLKTLREGRINLFELEALLREPSDYRVGCKEGVVVKDYANQRFAKYLHPEFSEVTAGRHLPSVDRYITSMRIRKTKNALLEEDNFSREQLITRIVRDVLTDQGVSLSRKEVERKLKKMDIDKI